MNDEKYMYFTERIQNTLLRPEILRMMKDKNSGDAEVIKQQKEKKEKEKTMSHGELMKVRQEEHEKRKRDRVDLLHATQTQEILVDPEFKKQKEIIQNEKTKINECVQVIQNDTVMQKDALAKRLAERKKRIAAKKGVDGSGSSFISTVSSPAIVVPKKDFEPILRKDEDGEPTFEEKNSSDEDELIKVSEVKLSPSKQHEKNYEGININEISAINNTTVGVDTSMNNSQIDLIRKLHSNALGGYQK